MKPWPFLPDFFSEGNFFWNICFLSSISITRFKSNLFNDWLRHYRVIGICIFCPECLHTGYTDIWNTQTDGRNTMSNSSSGTVHRISSGCYLALTKFPHYIIGVSSVQLAVQPIGTNRADRYLRWQCLSTDCPGKLQVNSFDLRAALLFDVSGSLHFLLFHAWVILNSSGSIWIRFHGDHNDWALFKSDPVSSKVQSLVNALSGKLF